MQQSTKAWKKRSNVRYLNRLKFSFFIPIYSKRKTRLVYWENHILEILSWTPCLKLQFFVNTSCRYCLDRIHSFFMLILNGVTSASRRHLERFCRCVCSRVTRFAYQPSRNLSVCSVKGNASTPLIAPTLGWLIVLRLLQSMRPLPVTSLS